MDYIIYVCSTVPFLLKCLWVYWYSRHISYWWCCRRQMQSCGLCCLYRLWATICEIEKMTTSSDIGDEKRSIVLLLCGNTRIWKCSQRHPQISQWLYWFFTDAGSNSAWQRPQVPLYLVVWHTVHCDLLVQQNVWNYCKNCSFDVIFLTEYDHFHSSSRWNWSQFQVSGVWISILLHASFRNIMWLYCSSKPKVQDFLFLLTLPPSQLDFQSIL